MRKHRRCLALCAALLWLLWLPAQAAAGRYTYSKRYAAYINGRAIAQTQAAQPAAGVLYQDAAAREVIRQVNAERAKAGLGALREDAELNRAARVRAGEIAKKFSHTRPDGTAWSTVSASAFGENIAMGQRTADKVMAAWLTSSGHRANILRGTYGSIGVCCLTQNGVTYWVQLFGR